MDSFDRPFRTPLNAARAFESAARLLSFTRAAQDLGVTQGAVSRQVATLESHLGQKLFQRVGRSIELTYAGQHYAADIREALARIESASARLMRRPEDAVLTVGATTVASRWLIGRLADFQRAHRALSVHLRVLETAAALHGSGIDIAVLGEDADSASLESREIGREDLIPVCSPDHPVPDTPAALARTTLLHLASHSDAWPRWFAVAGLQGADSLTGPVFEDAAMAVEAAIQGQGVAIVPVLAVGQAIESGRLTAPFDLRVPSGRRYYLTWPRAKGSMHKVRLFRDFLLAADGV
ncbi:MAG: LysR substrate-binding domain-containing protein [Proteobacteria bacterium]|nr:LysR substrate-binding domain-containing protein [Pseudomonadota bacterium]